MKRLLFTAAAAFIFATSGCSGNADSKVLARVNRSKITVADFKQQLVELPQDMQQTVVSDSKARKDFLEDLIGIEVVLQEARRRGLDKDAEFKRRVKEFIKNELFNSILKQELAGKVAFPTNQEVEQYYNLHKAELRSAEGKQLSLAEVSPKLRSWLYQQKQRQAYIEFAKGLKEKAKVTIDERALDTAVQAVSPPTELQHQHPPVSGEKK